MVIVPPVLLFQLVVLSVRYQVVVSINKIDVSLEQTSKVHQPIEVTESGIVTEEREVQPRKA